MGWEAGGGGELDARRTDEGAPQSALVTFRCPSSSLLCRTSFRVEVRETREDLFRKKSPIHLRAPRPGRRRRGRGSDREGRESYCGARSTMRDVAMRRVSMCAVAMRDVAIRRVSMRGMAMRGVAMRGVAMRGVAMRGDEAISGEQKEWGLFGLVYSEASCLSD